jgi:hypothetical protein
MRSISRSSEIVSAVSESCGYSLREENRHAVLRTRPRPHPLLAPDDVPAHPYKVAMEVASLAPNAEVTIYPWKDSQAHIDEVVEHARRFLKAHEPVRA